LVQKKREKKKKTYIISLVFAFGMIVASALIVWKSLMLITGSASPIVVVLSGSMEPAIYRGDLVFLWFRKPEQVTRGDICVYELPRKEIPIVHRIVHVHRNPGKERTTTALLTKGDNNNADDIPIYQEANPNLKWLRTVNLIGVGKAYVPWVGYATIAMADYPILKYLLIGGLAFFALVGNKDGN
jgi:signal peptidase